MVSVVRRARVPVAPATASTVFLRAGDVLAVIAIAAVLGPGLAHRLVGDAAIPLAAASALLLVAAAWWLGRVVRRAGGATRGWLVLAVPGAAAAWLLESVLIWSCAGWAGIDISPADAALVTAVTIAAQTVAIAPGGIGTYEAAATAALVGVGAGPGPALAAAVTAHAIKTVYALVAGGVGALAPAPGLMGRLRLATLPQRPPRAATAPGTPPSCWCCPRATRRPRWATSCAARRRRSPATRSASWSSTTARATARPPSPPPPARGSCPTPPRAAWALRFGAAWPRACASAPWPWPSATPTGSTRPRSSRRWSRRSWPATPTTWWARASAGTSATCAPTGVSGTWCSRASCGWWPAPRSPTGRAATGRCRTPRRARPRSSTTSTTRRC